MRETGKIGACKIIKRIFRFFMCGPRGPLEVLLWVSLWMVTVPVWFVSQFIMGILEVIVGEVNGTNVYIDGGGDGFFDEVSTRRRDDYQFITGTGKYAKER